MINHQVFATAPGGDLVTRIEYVRDDLHGVSGTPCRVDGAIACVATPLGLVGPRSFERRAVGHAGS